jgi:hypothetical protein
MNIHSFTHSISVSHCTLHMYLRCALPTGNFLARPAHHKIDYKMVDFHPKKITNCGHPPLRFWERPLVWSNFFRTFVMKKFDHINQKVREPITKRLLHTQFCNQNWPPTLVICNDLWENCNRSRGFKCYRRKNIVSPRRCTIERLWYRIWTICLL